MKKYSWLIPVSILIFVLGTLIFLSPLFVPKTMNWPIKQKLNLGLDLKGGTQILLSVVTDTLSAARIPDAVDNNIRIIRNRIDQYGIAEPTIQKVKETDILVQLPGVKESDAAAKLVEQTAVLQFKLVAENEMAEKFLNQYDAAIQANLQSFPALKKIDDADKAAQKGKSVKPDSLKAQVDTTATGGGVFRSLITTSERDFGVRDSDIAIIKELMKDSLFVSLRPQGFELALSAIDETQKEEKGPTTIYVLNSNVEVQGTDVDGASWQIGSSQSSDPKLANKPYISLNFTRNGARKFATCTGDNIGKRLAIVVDNIVYSAPVIQDRIPEGKATITGQFTNDEAKSLAILLDNESLSAPIVPKSSSHVSATLGKDSIRSGMIAGLIGFLCVFLFMLFYYKGAGMVADFVLIFNVGFILAALTAFGGTLTMPGIAGMILTIGMAVDANVLIFERIREELDSGKTPHTAVDVGFKRATVTIWDSNLTTIIAAVVLYQFGTGAVRGFALTLTIGIIGSMFCAIVFSRYIMEKTMLVGVKKTMSI